MGGKASLVLVIAFGVLFGIVGTNLIRTSNDANDNFVDYYKKEKAHSIATSALNIAANKIFFDHNWNAGLNNLPIAGGTVNVTVQNFGIYGKKITSISDFTGYSDTAIAWLEPKNFAQYGNFYDVMGSVWAAAGDTFSGPFHTNDFLQCIGHPVFRGFTTTTKGIKNFDGASSPELQGGFSLSANIPLSFDAAGIQAAAVANGKVFQHGGAGYINVKLNFNSDGTVTYWQRNGAGGPWGDSTRVALSTLAPNGVLYVKKGDVFIQGTLNGKVTLMANKNGQGGIIHISDDIVYKKNPLIEPSTDMLGLVAQEHVQLDLGSNPNARGDVNIHASMYSQNRGLIVETSNVNTFPEFSTAYKMNIVGGVIGKKVEATADYELIGGVWVPVRGYSYVHKFDERFNKEVPPFFPVTVKLRVVNWLE